MSEIEETTAASSHDAPRSARTEDLSRLIGDRPVAEREGLPRGYRMRADSHYVDQLEAHSSGPAVRLIPTRQIEPTDATVSGPDALAQSIALHGVVQPLLVRRRSGRYQLISGRKRLAAAIAAGISDVPCVTYEVDDAEAAKLAQADNLRFPDKPSVADADCLNQVLRVLSLDLARIGSSAALLGPTPHRTFQHRVAADFVQAQAWRAAWLANAAAVIVNQARTGRAATIASIVERVKTGFEPETRLTRLQLDCAVSPAAAGFTLDEDAGVTALTGCIFATLAWLEGTDDPRVEVRADAPTPRVLKIEVVQRTTIVPAEAARYLREAGHVPAAELTIALGLLAARCLATQHGGGVELTVIAGGGSIIQSTFSKPTAN